MGTDLVRAIFSVDDIFFLTLRKLIASPGHLAREYIAGRRVGYFGPLSLLAVLGVLDAAVRSWAHYTPTDAITDETVLRLSVAIEQARHDYQKIVLLSMVPVEAALSRLWFRRAGWNYAEHFVLNIYTACTGLLVSIATFGIIATLHPEASSSLTLTRLSVPASAGYAATLYYQCFSKFGYSRVFLALRSLFVVLSLYVVIVVVLAFVVLTRASKWP
ncbi:MAG: DUF3667 domain-containing protein [Polyangiaceae bacterium]